MTGRLKLRQGGELFYRFIDGDTNKPCLIFLHEGLGCTAMWKDFPDRLCRRTGFPGLLYDRLGYGRSTGFRAPRRVNYLHEYALVELPEVISALIPDRRFFLIGHSDGGSIGLIYASQKPELLMGIVSEAGHVFVDEKTLEGIRATGERFQAGKFDGLIKYHTDKTAAVFGAWHQTWLSHWFRHWNIEYLLPSVECPALVLQGADDPYGTIAQVDAIVSKLSGRCRKQIIDNCRHTPHQDQPARVLDFMAEFIAKEERRSS